MLVYPLDTGKKLLQVYQLNPGKSVKEFLRDHYHLTGVRGLYAGAMAAMLKSGLSSGLLFGFYTLAKTFLNFRVCETNATSVIHESSRTLLYVGRTYLFP